MEYHTVQELVDSWSIFYAKGENFGTVITLLSRILQLPRVQGKIDFDEKEQISREIAVA